MNFRTDHKPGERLQQTVALVCHGNGNVGVHFVFVALGQNHHWLKLLARTCSSRQQAFILSTVLFPPRKDWPMHILKGGILVVCSLC